MHGMGEKMNQKISALLFVAFISTLLFLQTKNYPQVKASIEGLPDYVYRVDPTGFVCGDTGPAPNIVELRGEPEDNQHELEMQVQKCDGANFSQGGTYEIWADLDTDMDFDSNDLIIDDGSYQAGDPMFTNDIDPVENALYGPRYYVVKAYSKGDPTIDKHTGIIMAWEEYIVPQPSPHDNFYSVDPSGYTCGSYITAQFVPNSITHDIEVYIGKCSGEPFEQNGKAYVYLDGVPKWGPFDYQAGNTTNFLGYIDPLDIGFSGTHSYQVFAYAAEQPTNPNKYSGTINAWNTSDPPVCVVPFFSQEDPQWRNYPLNGCGGRCSTIGNCGCTLTSTAMVFSYYGANLTPATLSDCMGYLGCPFHWTPGGEQCSQGQASFTFSSGFNWSTLETELNQNHRPVILGMHRNNNTHWVVVISGSGTNYTNYTIHDPGSINGANRNLDFYTSRGWIPDSIRVYSGDTECSGLVGENPILTTITSQPLASLELEPNSLEALSIAEVKSIVGSPVITGTIKPYDFNYTTMNLQLEATSQDGNVTEMLIWTDTTPQATWQPYSPYVNTPISEVFYARFRDTNGNVSGIASDTLFPQYSPPFGDFQSFLPSVINLSTP